jgi:hypothetical protein
MRRLAFISALLACGSVHAHGGGLDAQGCHTNRKTGDYHCHRPQGPPSGNSSAAPQQQQQQSGSQTCYTGPRGGTYTITKSGRKNYAGC